MSRWTRWRGKNVADQVVVNGMVDCAECGEEHIIKNLLVDKTMHTFDYVCPVFRHRVLAGACDDLMRKIP